MSSLCLKTPLQLIRRSNLSSAQHVVCLVSHKHTTVAVQMKGFIVLLLLTFTGTILDCYVGAVGSFQLSELEIQVAGVFQIKISIGNAPLSTWYHLCLAPKKLICLFSKVSRQCETVLLAGTFVQSNPIQSCSFIHSFL